MPLSLHAIIVPTCQQMLGSVARLIDMAQAHCADLGLPPETILEARLAPDMLPFAYQVKSAVVHSVGAIEGVTVGMFRPDTTTPPDSFDGLREQVAGALETMGHYDPAAIDALEGSDMQFGFGDATIDFTAEDFLLSFSQPNFYFHVTTTYSILRAQGVSIGKRDYLGRMRKKR